MSSFILHECNDLMQLLIFHPVNNRLQGTLCDFIPATGEAAAGGASPAWLRAACCPGSSGKAGDGFGVK